MANETEALAMLIINLCVPGLGTYFWGDRTHGIWQLVLLIVGAILAIVIIGIFAMAAAWIWALVDSIRVVQSVGSKKKSSRRPSP